MKFYFSTFLFVVFIFKNASATWKDSLGNYLPKGVKASSLLNPGLTDSSEKPTRPDRLQTLLNNYFSTQIENSWNPGDASENMIVKETDPLTCHRNPTYQSTDGIRGKIGYTSGFHVWELHWNLDKRGEFAVVGVATAEAPLHADGYKLLLGSDHYGWGWGIGKNRIYHSNDTAGLVYPTFFNPDVYKVPEKLLVVLDMDEGTLAFDADNQYLGVAFTGLKGSKVFPAISSVFGDSEITIRYMSSTPIKN